MGRDYNTRTRRNRRQRFQSTRPVWGATRGHQNRRRRRADFNPRAPYGARPVIDEFQGAEEYISIHAPRMGRDQIPSMGRPHDDNFNPRAPYGARHISVVVSPRMFRIFQSTRPVWGATLPAVRLWCVGHISIHAPRMGRDWRQCQTQTFRWHFNPRAPYGARRFHSPVLRLTQPFQSTRPVWGATPTETAELLECINISIHAPRMGRDLIQLRINLFELGISIHAPRMGRDKSLTSSWTDIEYFNPRAPYGARPADTVVRTRAELFQSTRPVWGATENHQQET